MGLHFDIYFYLFIANYKITEVMVQEMNSTLDAFTLRVNGTSLRGFICKTVRYIQMQT